MAKKKIRNSSKFKVGSTLLLTIVSGASGFAASGFSLVSSSSSPENIFAYLKAALHLDDDSFLRLKFFFPTWQRDKSQRTPGCQADTQMSPLAPGLRSEDF